MMFDSKLVWADEQYSLEERRAMLPKYAAARARAAAAAAAASGAPPAVGVVPMGAGNGAAVMAGGLMHAPVQHPVI
jgi:hypothetical protein